MFQYTSGYFSRWDTLPLHRLQRLQPIINQTPNNETMQMLYLSYAHCTVALVVSTLLSWQDYNWRLCQGRESCSNGLSTHSRHTTNHRRHPWYKFSFFFGNTLKTTSNVNFRYTQYTYMWPRPRSCTLPVSSISPVSSANADILACCCLILNGLTRRLRKSATERLVREQRFESEVAERAFPIKY